jgi:uncharacterized protein YukE
MEEKIVIIVRSEYGVAGCLKSAIQRLVENWEGVSIELFDDNVYTVQEMEELEKDYQRQVEINVEEVDQ